MSDILGFPLGTCFELQNGKAVAVQPNAMDEDVDEDNVDEIEENNREIFDSTLSQKLSHEEILNMKHSHTSLELIENLKANNESFSKKTKYSQAKYTKRKKKKFHRVFCVYKIDAFSLCNHLFRKNPQRILGMRIDTFSQILTLSNASVGSNILMIDNTHGLMAGAVIQRLEGKGSLYLLHDHISPNIELLKDFNFTEEERSCLKPIPFDNIHKEFTPTWKESTEELSDERKKLKLKKLERHMARISYQNQYRADFLAGNLDGLVLVCDFDAKSVLLELTKFIGGSRPIIIYAEHKEQLLDCYDYCFHSSNYIFVQLTESFLREYQVLPGRMHPNMRTSGSGGFILSMIRVLDE